MSTVCTSSTSIFCFATANSFVVQLKQCSFSLQTEKPAGFRFFLLLPVCCLFYFSQEVTSLVTPTRDVSLTLSPIYQSAYKAHFSQMPQTRNSLRLLHSFSTNCVKKQQNPASGNMFPFLVLLCIVTISFTVTITNRQTQAANSDQKSRDVCVLWLVCLGSFVPLQLYK